MVDQMISSIVTIATAIIGIAILAVLVSRNANTAGVISAGAGGLAQDIGAAVSPVTGGSGASYAIPSYSSGNVGGAYG